MTSGNLGDVFDRERDMDRVALIECGPQNERQFTYRDIDDGARAVARSLIDRGFVRGDRIAIMAGNSANYLIAYFGIMRAGLIAVPVNFKFPRALAEHVLSDSGARLVFVDRDNQPLIPNSLPIVSLDGEGNDSFEHFLDPGAFDTVAPDPDDIAMILYTSGSSGRPKGVRLCHEGQVWAVRARVGVTVNADSHRLLVAAPLYHMNGLAISTVAMAAHASEVLMTRFRAADYIRAAVRYRCTWLTSVPTMLALVAKETALLEAADFSLVQIVSMGSAPVSDNLMSTLRAIFPGRIFVNGYGTTESGAVCFGAHPDGLARPPLSLGYPLPEIQVRLTDNGNSDGNQGVFQIKSPALMSGYHNLPDKTAEVMTGDGYYITGDVMRRDENGFFFFVARDDDTFVCGGENIVPGAVESMLETHPEIAQASVVPVADDIRGHMPVAFVVRLGDSDLDEQSVKDYALENATPQEHPRRVFFLDELPLAGTNKIDRNALEARAAREV